MIYIFEELIKLVFIPLNCGCGFEHYSAFDWALAIPNKQSRNAALRNLIFDNEYYLDETIDYIMKRENYLKDDRSYDD